MQNIKKIHQIYITDSQQSPSTYVADKMHKLKELYSDYEYQLYDNDMCKEVIRSMFGEKIVSIYDSLIPYAFKADLARYCILYKYGGYYFDVSICPEFKIECEEFPILYKAPLGSCDGFAGIDNGVMLFNVVQHQFLFDAIESSIKNIKKKDYDIHPLSLTGPVMLGELDEYDISFGRSKYITPEQKGAFYKNELHWLYKPNGTYLHTFNCKGTNSYEELWQDKKVYT